MFVTVVEVVVVVVENAAVKVKKKKDTVSSSRATLLVIVIIVGIVFATVCTVYVHKQSDGSQTSIKHPMNQSSVERYLLVMGCVM